MASAARALGALLHKASSLSSASALRSAAVLHGRGSVGRASLFQMLAAKRRISTFQPLCMGRRSCKIAGRKDAQNLKKMKRNSKIGKEIVAAIKKGGPSPSSNTALAAILEKARELDIPKEIMERNIKRASEKGQDTYTEKVYEVYGFGGVGMVVEVLTDKITRSIADIRNVVKDCGAKLADPGSVTFRFRQARVVNIKVTDADKDQLLSVALDAGADDVIEPNFDEDDDDDNDDNDDSSEDVSERFYKIVTTSENYPVVLSKLQEEGLKFETDNGYELLPLNPIEADDEAMELNKVLVSKLLELDDVDAVYTDQR
ncbi:probable transcriptional regulatory protein At2g25830 isoform X2 [Oryza brachyantha]|uniref:Transcriptional regulatory protein n=1 Tax=Oryza brachyantha TaxID=4533 RepID=J3M8Y9_ORYBR|nr:probable transcriptional regulatory protein At2g25830 isoform X2 [Oryza brachyantha]